MNGQLLSIFRHIAVLSINMQDYFISIFYLVKSISQHFYHDRQELLSIITALTI